MEKIELVAGLNESAHRIYKANAEKGFWDKERNVGEMLMLVVSELGEAMEAHRKGLLTTNEDWLLYAATDDFKSNIKDKFEDEIADAIIRLLDMCGGLSINIEEHIQHKVAYNQSREKFHGKKY